MDDYFVQVPPSDGREPERGPDHRDVPPPARTGVSVAALLGVLVVALAGAVGLVLLVVRASGGPDPAARAVDAPAATALVPADTPVVEDGFRIWARRDDGGPVRWDPCEPVRWVLNPDGAPPTARADLEVAFSKVASATGIRFVFEGTTDEVPEPDRPVHQPERYGDRWAPVLIAWVTPSQTRMPILESDAGVAVPVAVRVGDAHAFVSAQVVLDQTEVLQGGFGDRTTSWGGVLQHELAHVVGLDHVDDPRQLMHPVAQPGPSTFASGDLAGLRALGAERGCVDVPRPQPVDVGFDHGF
ncbi:MAG: matrixin family metalloprotease [Actinomycetes bacterium]